mmetsp:Transcript_44377/g.87686  ORF Transcript_44377/g.87686 Transcript_44377/m.87686 type:complete len:215 (+) Transcript_44377:1938-2582(+)
MEVWRVILRATSVGSSAWASDSGLTNPHNHFRLSTCPEPAANSNSCVTISNDRDTRLYSNASRVRASISPFRMDAMTARGVRLGETVRPKKKLVVVSLAPESSLATTFSYRVRRSALLYVNRASFHPYSLTYRRWSGSRDASQTTVSMCPFSKADSVTDFINSSVRDCRPTVRKNPIPFSLYRDFSLSKSPLEAKPTRKAMWENASRTSSMHSH